MPNALPSSGADRLVRDRVAEAMAIAATLVDEGRIRDAITLLMDANRHKRSPRLERALVELRHAGFDQAIDAPHPSPRVAPFQLGTTDGLPMVTPAELGLGPLRQGLDQFGCLCVPGLLSAHQVARLVDGIDRTFEAFDDYSATPLAPRDEEAEAWFTPFEPVGAYAGRELGGRMFTRSTGGIWTVESPRMMFEVIELFEEVGLGTLIADHLGEWPALSAAKCNLRRTPIDVLGGWHQDGSFMGRDISTIDVWIALSDCGRDAPGLDVVPHRFDYLLETGFDAVVVPHEKVLDAVEPLGVEIVSREFRAGDVMLFDHMFLHRTAVAPAMVAERHALETWFFAPSSYPERQIPILY